MEYIDDAIKIVAQGPKEIPKKAIVARFGNLAVFSKKEKDQFEGVLLLIQGYITQKAPERPLCIGLFGPPGSGKSFSVEEIIATAMEQTKCSEKNISMPMRIFNLTQIHSARELTELLGQSIVSDNEKVVPVLFFDEFDAPLDGSPLGWLSWFLAPMHDGHFQQRGTTVPLGRAIFVFAGGTSSEFRDFSERKDPEFKSAKGSDFVSRLRGTLDILGPNDRSARDLRRAIILWKSLNDRNSALHGKKSGKTLKISKNLTKAFLHSGRFRYGARSIGAIVEMCKIPEAKGRIKTIKVHDLPAEHLLESHVDRGPLDSQEIGGAIGLSARAEKNSQKEYEDVWKRVAKELWEQGATLMYGGNADKGGLTKLLTEEADKLPSGSLHTSWSLSLPYLRWIDISGKANVSEDLKKYVSVEPVPEHVTLRRKDFKARIKEATEEPEIQKWLSESLRQHRLRCQMNGQCIARVVIGGKLSGYSGRFPGILEETILAMHSKKPVYVIGGFGGAAAAVGGLLGFCTVGGARALASLQDPFDGSGELPENLRGEGKKALDSLSDLFCDGNEQSLPLDYYQAIDFLWKHPFGGTKWVDNGLSRTENQTLFESKDPDEICSILIRGIKRAML